MSCKKPKNSVIVMTTLTKREKTTLQKWMREQNIKVDRMSHTHKTYYCPNGGCYTYIITPTSMGNVTEVRNNITKDEIDITDYGAW